MSQSSHYHFIGIGGIGMSALAHILVDRGYHVTGSDLAEGKTIQKLREKGVLCFLGHSAKHIPDSGIVVYGSGITKDNIEYQTALNKSLKIIHRAELLSELIQESTSILVSGSHGKTTVSSLIAAIFRADNRDPSYAIGGLNSESLNGYSGSSDYFIAEADESDGSLYHYTPYAVILTNLDDEHLQNYHGCREELLKALQDFSRKVFDMKYCFYNGDCPHLKGKIHGTSYGFSPECALHIFSHKQVGWQSVFSISFLGRKYTDITLNLIGTHNIANAAAAIGIALLFGIKEDSIRSALENFSGVQRRLERRNISDKFLFLEDYAHHPSEIVCTLRAVREAIGMRRLIAICQPHRFSRLKDCLDSFPKAFLNADQVILTDIYSAGEARIHSLSEEELANQIINHSHVNCVYVPYDELVDYLRLNIRLHDVCISLGAGSIYAIGTALEYFEPKKLSLGIIYGGESCEHDISVLSAKYFSEQLPKDWYDVHYFLISRQGLWTKVSAIFPEANYADQGSHVLSSEIVSSLNEMDCIIPVLHGPFGEDGAMQGFLEIIGKPYTGPSVLSAAVAMNKVITKQLVSSSGVPVVPYHPISLHMWQHNPKVCVYRILEDFSFPMFVKSAHLGSSIGVYQVNSEEELYEKVTEAFLYDTDVFVEEHRLGSREIEVSCLGDSSGSYYIADPHERRGESGFISYKEKYGFDGHASAEIIFDIDLSLEQKNRVKNLARIAFQAIKGQGSSRIDFFLDEEGMFWLSEINPIPGMTRCSPFLASFTRNGWTIAEIAHHMIIEAMYQFNNRKSRLTKLCCIDPLIKKS
ncbi:UDP-N-acetylmuramate--alanine ligase [Chlamydia ibidis]|uniref:Multifunctional fusion protein n=3 Tax=Chlamydia ibidis TaxID=1405396 RepID=S7KKA7_9CHLA|nr:bifunctional UDP-N-acetylmuramate--L-alanine ligase/D-alanine--D-alanine ligase [Chlamydia ibidis]EPP34865.1 UDP-N-acetylmuramate--alanine ligase [Chlamydia ibidis]